jgi:RNA polymerase sigma-70 factor (ECF subfamily)
MVDVMDADLLDEWRAGDVGSGDELFKRHYDAIYRFFARKLALEDVEELVQRTFLPLVEGRERYRGDASVRTFVFAIARNLLLTHFRERRALASVDPTEQSLADLLAPSPTQALSGKQDNRLLLEALRCIPLDLQMAIELRYWEEFEAPEIARILDIPLGTTWSRIRRGLERLRKEVERLAVSRDVLGTTLSSLDEWARQVRPEST